MKKLFSLKVLILSSVTLLFGSPIDQDTDNVFSLTKREPIKKELSVGQSHTYQIRLARNYFLFAAVKQIGIDVTVRVVDPDGTEIETIDSPTGKWSEEHITLVTDQSGYYQIEVSPLDEDAEQGEYEIAVRKLRVAARTPSRKVDQLFAPWDSPDSPGAAVAVIKDGKIVYKKGYGTADLEHNIPVTPSSVFYIGSTSKQFVAMSTLLLVEQGRLSLDDDIRQFLPEFPEYDRPITVRHLIHHTSGIRDYLTLWNLSGNDYLDYMSEDAVHQLICRQKELNFSPGEQFLYSNSCYFLLALIIERASGKSLREFAEENIFELLGMENSHFHDSNRHIIKNRAFGYSPMGKDGFGNLIMRFDLVGSGGLYTTVEDLYLWDQNFYNNRLGKSGQDLISTMLTDGKLSNGEGVDYAFALVNGNYRGLRTVQHGGALGGYRAQLLRFPEQDFSVVILSNLAGFDPSSLAYKVADCYLEKHFESAETSAEEEKEPIERKEVSVDPAIYDSYVGEYQLETGLIITISKEHDRLMGQATGQPKVELFPESETKFFQKGADVELSFQKDENGDFSQLIIHQNGQDMLAKRIETFTLTERQLEAFAGDYYSDELQVFYGIFIEDGKLFIQIKNNPRIEMKVSGKDVFDGKGQMSFSRDTNGNIGGFTLDVGRVKNLKFVRQRQE